MVPLPHVTSGNIHVARFAAAGVDDGQVHHSAKTKSRPRMLRLLPLACQNTRSTTHGDYLSATTPPSAMPLTWRSKTPPELQLLPPGDPWWFHYLRIWAVCKGHA